VERSKSLDSAKTISACDAGDAGTVVKFPPYSITPGAGLPLLGSLGIKLEKLYNDTMLYLSTHRTLDRTTGCPASPGTKRLQKRLEDSCQNSTALSSIGGRANAVACGLYLEALGKRSCSPGYAGLEICRAEGFERNTSVMVWASSAILDGPRSSCTFEDVAWEVFRVTKYCRVHTNAYGTGIGGLALA